MATVEDTFKAAINVIKGLPKNGPYQPTTAMMLKFYGLYKQATEGPCLQKKPAFWDIVGKAKWDAWNSNRHLTKEQAMKKYVDGLREIIETMSFTTDVADFVGSVSGLDNINLDELEMIAPGMREIAESHPNSPFNSRTNSPQHGASANAVVLDESPIEPSTGHILNGVHNGITEKTQLNGDIDSDTDASIKVVPLQEASIATTNSYAISNGTVEQSDDEYGDPIDMHHEFTEAVLKNSELLKQIQATVLRMNADLVAVSQRMSTLEKSVRDVRLTVQQKSSSAVSNNSRSRRDTPKWWPFEDISPVWFAFLILWPFVVRRLSSLTERRK